MLKISTPFSLIPLKQMGRFSQRAGFIVVIITLIFSPVFGNVSLAEETQSASTDAGSALASSGQSSVAPLESVKSEPVVAPKPAEQNQEVAPLPQEVAPIAPEENPAENVNQDGQEPGRDPGNDEEPPIAAITNLSEEFKLEALNGMASLNIPIKVVPGRHGLEPKVSLKYSSTAENGWVGTGWYLELGFIQRSTKKGVPRYNNTDTFVLNQVGSTDDLVSIGNNQYRPKIEGAFAKIEFMDNAYWLVTDKSGVKYYFGQNNDSRQFDSANQEHVFKWSLDRIEDLPGNYLTASYQKIGNQLYPRFIDYTGNAQEEVAPYAQVEFELEGDNRRDIINSYKTGFLVSTTKRLANIYIKTNDVLQRRYQLDYSYIESTNRSVLNSVAQYDSADENHLPATNLVYQDSSLQFHDPVNWTNNWEQDFADVVGDRRVFNGDFNGDALTDLAFYSNGGLKVSLSTGDAYTQPVDWINHWNRQWDREQLGRMVDNGVVFTGDFNGDGLTDIAYDGNQDLVASFSTGSSFANPVNYWDQQQWVRDLIGDRRIFNGDFNGDGLTDLAYYRPSLNNRETDHFQVMLATGRGFTDPIDWTRNWDNWLANWLRSRDPNHYRPAYFFMGDFNGDGLTDLAFYTEAGFRVALSTGSSFLEPVDWTGNWDRWFIDWINTNNNDNHVFLGDFNGDNLTDLAYYTNIADEGNFHFNGDFHVILSTGSSFLEPPVDWTRNWQQRFSQAVGDNGHVLIGDFNGDSLTDTAFYNNGGLNVGLVNGSVPYLLSSMNNNLGAVTQVTYTPSVNYDNTGDDDNSDLPFSIPVISRLVTTDQTLNQSYTTTYDYRGGYYNAPAKEFRGFGWIKKIGGAGNYTETDFLQDDIYQGRIAEQRSYDAEGHLFTKTVNTWNSQNLHEGVNFPYLSQAGNYTYDGDNTGRRNQTKYFYEEDPQYGNLTRTVELGEVNLENGEDLDDADNRITRTEYSYNSDDWLVNLPKTNFVQDVNNNVLKQSWLYYDNQDYGSAPTLGNLTKQENWLKTNTNARPVAGNRENPKITFTYDAFGNLLTTTDPIGNITRQANDRTATITYDPDYHLFPLTTVNALGHRTQTVYYGVNNVPLDDGTYHGLFGQVKSNTDANNVTSSNIYDSFGRLTKVIGPLDTVDLPTTLMEYDLDNIPITATTHSRIEHNQQATQDAIVFYDGLGRTIQTKTTAEQGAEHDFIALGSIAFNELGQVARQYLNFYADEFDVYTAPADQAPFVGLNYDALGRVTSLIQPDESQTTTAYQDWVTTITDANGHIKKSYNDAFGRLGKIKEYTGADGRDEHYPETQGAVDNHYTLYSTTNYSYDLFNNLTGVIDALGNRTIITFDSLNRKTAMNDPDMGNWTYKYDLAGNLISQLDAKNQLINFSYDDLNRIISKQYPQVNAGLVVPGVIYYYDDRTVPYAKGRLTKVSQGAQESRFYYDALGREIHSSKKIDNIGYHLFKTYDALGRLKTLSYPEGETLTYIYNAQGQLESLRNQRNYSYVRESSYNQNNQLTNIRYGNGTQTSYTYNPITLRLTRLETRNIQNQPIQDLSYSYDGVRNVTTLTDWVNQATQNFAYDSLNRLTSALNPLYGLKNYGYNQIGNLTDQNELILTYDQNLAGPHAVTSLSNGINFTYDLNGNLIRQMVAADNLSVYQYDAENQLINIKKNNQNLADFKYDGQGNRIKKTIYRPGVDGLESATTLYINELYEKTGNLGKRHIFFGPQKIATVSGNNEKNYYHVNQLGSTDVLTDITGRQITHYEYAPFGQTSVNNGEDATRYKFTGKEFDDETGLYYYGARYYNPAIGRFITADTIVQSYGNPQNLNRYSYVNNNPVNYTDPTGHCFEDACVLEVSGGLYIAAEVGPILIAAALAVAVTVKIAGGTISKVVNGGLKGLSKGAFEDYHSSVRNHDNFLETGIKVLINVPNNVAEGIAEEFIVPEGINDDFDVSGFVDLKEIKQVNEKSQNNKIQESNPLDIQRSYGGFYREGARTDLNFQLSEDVQILDNKKYLKSIFNQPDPSWSNIISQPQAQSNSLQGGGVSSGGSGGGGGRNNGGGINYGGGGYYFNEQLGRPMPNPNN